MASSITASVGKNGANRPEDVRTVQAMLNKVPSEHGGPAAPLEVDGLAWGKTADAIERFQKIACEFKSPDGRVDPNGKTFAKLATFQEPRPFDAESEQAVLAKLDPSEGQMIAKAIASYARTVGGLIASAEPTYGWPEIRARCSPKGCDPFVTIEGETFGLNGCGDGTCPTCPPGMGNLIVRAWCSYEGVETHRAAVVLILVFGAKWGPFLVP